MKKLLLCMAASCIILTGCLQNKDVRVKEYTTLRFQATGNKYQIDGAYWTEYVDTETNNLYLCTVGRQTASGMSPLYDENGNIAKYDK